MAAGGDDIRSGLAQIRSQIRIFLLRINSRELLIFAFFLFVSFSFWGIRTLNETYQYEVEVPFEITHVPRATLFTSEVPTTVKVKVEDRGTILLNYLLAKHFVPLQFRFEAPYVQENRYVLPVSEILKAISSRLNASTRILSIKPEIFEFLYTEGVGKKVPVVTNSLLDTQNQYYVSSIHFKPDTVVAYAPPALLDSVIHAAVEPLSFRHLTDNMKRKVRLDHLPGVKFQPAEVEMEVNLDVYSEKTVEVPVKGIGFPPGKQLRTFPSKVQVTFQVGLQSFKKVTAADFELTIDYQAVRALTADKVPVTLKVLSSLVNHPRVNPLAVEYLIEEKNPNE